MNLAAAGFALLAALVTLISAQDNAAPAPIENVITVEFPEGGYTFRLAEAARGVKLDYTVRVAADFPGVITLQTEPSFNEPAGPSGMYPHESISGKGQLYSLTDFGRGLRPKEVARTIKKGVYKHTFAWDGRNWTGPSDFNNPKGKPFPAGMYDVTVTMHGKARAEKGLTPYRIVGKTKLLLK